MSQNSDSRTRLEPFDRRWAETVLGWITSPDELFHWAARSGFPLTDVSVFVEWHSDPEVVPYSLLIEDEIVAYGEVWRDAAEGSAELGRLVVSPQHRRQGLARLLVERLASLAQEAGSRQIWVRVLPANAAALRCYESVGFNAGVRPAVAGATPGKIAMGTGPSSEFRFGLAVAAGF